MQNLAVYIVISAWFLAVTSIIARVLPFWRGQVEQQTRLRFPTVEGLRGFLALAVFFHHALVNRHYLLTGQWEADSKLWPFIASFGVSTFFMITCLLFWQKVLAAHGAIAVKPLYESRIRRLVPLYAFSISFVFVVVAYLSNFGLKEPAREVTRAVICWMSFGILGNPDINGVATTFSINAGVQWTLAYEWAFYVSLPLLALAWKRPAFFLLIGAIVVYGLLIWELRMIVDFAGGMLTAYIVRDFRFRPVFTHWCWAFIAIFALVSAYFVPNAIRHLLFFVFFLVVAHGNSFGGVLLSKAARVLGIASYSVYLMHGIVLFCVFRFVDRFYRVPELEPAHFWSLVAASGTVVVIVSTFTYRFVEYPFLIRRDQATRTAP